MQEGETLSLEQIRAFLEASAEMHFHTQGREELYKWINETLRQQDYGHLKREGKGLLRRYVSKLTGLSRAQVARLMRLLPARRASEAAKVSAASLFESLHAHRHRTACATGRLSRKPQRSGHAKNTAAGVA